MQKQGTGHEKGSVPLFQNPVKARKTFQKTLRQGSGTSAPTDGFRKHKKPRDAVDWMVCMSKYVLKRLAMLIPVLIGVTFMVYFILSLSPG